MHSYDTYSRQFMNAIGLGRTPVTRRFTDNMLSPTMMFGAGLLVGAGIALVLTPKTGRQLRNDLSRQASQLTERVREQMPAMGTGKGAEHADWEENIAST